MLMDGYGVEVLYEDRHDGINYRKGEEEKERSSDTALESKEYGQA